jgi:hypothetical protein
LSANRIHSGMQQPIRYAPGEAVGPWTIIEESKPDANGNLIWSVRHLCGAERIARGSRLRHGRVRCIQCSPKKTKQVPRVRKKQRRSELYSTWRDMKDRCHRPACKSYHRYGGRGIRVCDRWRDSFSAFVADMGPRPSPSHTIDRIDGTRGYEPDNCRWATQKEQQRNRLNNVRFDVGGAMRTLGEISELTGIPERVLKTRARDLGWSIQDAIGIPYSPGRPARGPIERGPWRWSTPFKAKHKRTA